MTKFCTHCGKEINGNAVICVHCGCATPSAGQLKEIRNINDNTGKRTQVSMILGIVGIVFAFLFALIGHITSIIGIIFGVKEYKETNRITGLTLSIVGEVCSILSSIIGAVTVASMM